MAGLDVEALLESTAQKNGDGISRLSHAADRSERPGSEKSPSRHERDRNRDRGDLGRERDHEREIRKRRERSPLWSRAGSASSREGTQARSDAGSPKRISRSRDDRRNSRRYRDRERDRNDHHRSRGRRGRSRSRSPYGGRRRRNPDDRRDDRRDSHDDRCRRRDDGRRRREPTPTLNEDERDRRTVFVQQLAARLRTKDLKSFFEQAGPVAEAQIVKDRVSLRSKGVGYVEFKDEASVQAALQLTGQKLLGIPVIVQLTEAEKNRQVRVPGEATTHSPNPKDGNHGQHQSSNFNRLYVGNIHFSITENDIQNVFEPFGELEFVQLQKDENGRSRGYGFVQFRDAAHAKEALDKMNGFDLAGRPIRVGLGNEKYSDSAANALRSQNQGLGPGASHRALPTPTFDRAGGRDNAKGTGASALDDADVSGVNFNNYSRDALMRKLARTDELPTTPVAAPNEEKIIMKPKTEVKPLPLNIHANMASRCVVLHNMFNPAEEEGDNWVKELEDDVRQEAEEKYGHVVHISLDPTSQGDIYLKFDKVQGGENAIKGLNGRYFGGRMISAAPVVDAVYSSLFSRSKAM